MHNIYKLSGACKFIYHIYNQMEAVYINKLPKRKNIRLKNYDYSQAGYYFVTICSSDKKKLFWNVGETCVTRERFYCRI